MDKNAGKKTEAEEEAFFYIQMEKRYALADVLLQNIKSKLPELEKLIEKASDHWNEEDRVYRFYHHSFKVYWLQDLTKEIWDALVSIKPDPELGLCKMFLEIMDEGCSGREWKLEDNQEWGKNCRSFVEAFWHASYFLRMVVKYGKELEKAPNCLPSGWAAVLELYRIR